MQKSFFSKPDGKTAQIAPPKFGSATHCAYLCTVEAKTQRNINHQLSTITAMSKKETWKFILQILLSVVSAIATAFGVSSCMG